MTSAPSLPAIAMPPPATLLVSRARVPPHKRDLTHFLSANASGRDWLVGDVHGHFSRLKAAMDAAGFNPLQDRLLSVGDLVDRGPESPAVIEWLSQPWFYAIRGNHEQMFLEYHAQPSAAARRRYMARAWEANGGAWAARLTEAQRTAIAEQLQRLPYLMAVDVGAGVSLLLAHACMPSGSAWPTL
ncbi:metallophosphoesterase, partial [Metallibacterium scheffleri]|uniref:metallophosphoesterase n=1 Tax=Metallibacterium scheffleri TaxID=993689 RepID=UPI0023F06DD4